MDDSESTRELGRLLVPLDPSGAAVKILTHLVRRAAAAGGAVLVPREPRPALIAVCDLSIDRLPDVHALWAQSEAWLLRGQPIQQPSHVLLPIRSSAQDDRALLGALYLDGPARFDMASTLPFLEPLAEAIIASGAVRQAPPIAVGRGRQGLLDLLNRNEWNIARVARLCGTTRRTIYLRMRRYGIARERVPKAVYRSRKREP